MPSVYCLFPQLKKHLKGNRFHFKLFYDRSAKYLKGNKTEKIKFCFKRLWHINAFVLHSKVTPLKDHRKKIKLATISFISPKINYHAIHNKRYRLKKQILIII